MLKTFHKNYNTIAITNRYSPLESIESFQQAHTSNLVSKPKCAGRKVNKRQSQYTPTWLLPQQFGPKSIPKQFSSRQPNNINDLEIAQMNKIKDRSQNLSSEMRTSVNKHIGYLSSRYSDYESFQCCLKESPDVSKLKGGAKSVKPKTFKAKDNVLNSALNFLRSTQLLYIFDTHQKCSLSENCSFCFLRSCISKINQIKGRQSIIPIEVEAQNLSTSLSSVPMICEIINSAAISQGNFKKAISSKWHCSCCLQDISHENILMELGECQQGNDIMDMIDQKFKELEEDHLGEIVETNKHQKSFSIMIPQAQKSCIFVSSFPFNIKLDAFFSFGNKLWKCAGAMKDNGETYFKLSDEWFTYLDYKTDSVRNCSVSNIICVIFDVEDLVGGSINEEFCYTGNDLEKLRNRMDRHKNKGDRHVNKEERNKEDRHVN